MDYPKPYESYGAFSSAGVMLEVVQRKNAMTEESLTTDEKIEFRILAEQHTLKEFGYHVSNLRPFGDRVYDVILKQLGEIEEISFPVFAEQVRDSVRTKQLPEGLLRSFEDYFKSRVAQVSRMGR
jgi:hypothetical protein